jgi:glycosyltransferase involved in cell wall biosynthesis
MGAAGGSRRGIAGDCDRREVKVLYLEASSGQVVGGSLTGMLQLIGALDRDLVTPTVVLYEEKAATKTLHAQGIRVRIFSKRRLSKEHSLQFQPTYEKAKGYPGITPALKSFRAALTFAFETLPAALRLSTMFREEAPDIIHVCNGFRGNLDAIVAARMTGIPCIVHCKGFDKHSFIERLFAPDVAAAVCMTVAIEEHCKAERVGAPEYHVIYDGLDLAEFVPTRDRNDVREELGIDPDAPVVGVVGNMQELKGQHVLLEAMREVVKTHPKAVALIVGGAHRSGRAYAEGLRKYVTQHGLEDNVIFTGAREDVPDVMNAMDVIAHTSVRGEPFGRVIIEGMSVGRPVVATAAGGVPEFVHHGEDGLLVQPGDAAELASVLRTIFDDAELRRRLSVGALEAVKHFSVEKHVEEITRLYRRVADGQGRASRAVSLSGESSADTVEKRA